MILHPHAIWGVLEYSAAILSYPRSPAEGLSPEQPANIEPPDGAALTQEPVILKTSPFKAPDWFYTHTASEWKVASDPGFP
jgi:hypothetical protein